METKEFKVIVPEGMEIDKENSTFECIRFKPIKPKRWRDNENALITGYYVDSDASINYNADTNSMCNYNIFATKKQAKSALAMARISQIMANDERLGGVVTDEEWLNEGVTKYVIKRENNYSTSRFCTDNYHFLAFHTPQQRDLFLEENEDLVKDYLMLE